MKNLVLGVLLVLSARTALASANLFTPQHRYPDLNQMDPAFKTILGEGWPLCAPVIGGNLVAWLLDRKIAKDPAVKSLDVRGLEPWVRKFASKDYMNTRDGHGTDGADFLKGLDKGLRDLGVKAKVATAGPAYGADPKISTLFFEAPDPKTVYFLFVGFYRPSTSAPGLRRQRGHTLMVFADPDHKGRFLAVDTSAESAGAPAEHSIEILAQSGLQFRQENRFFKGQPGSVLELKGIATPANLNVEKIIIEGAASYSF